MYLLGRILALTTFILGTEVLLANYISVSVNATARPQVTATVQFSQNVGIRPTTNLTQYATGSHKLYCDEEKKRIYAYQTVTASVQVSASTYGSVTARVNANATVSGNAYCTARGSDGSSGYGSDYFNDSGYSYKTDSTSVYATGSDFRTTSYNVVLASAEYTAISNVGYSVSESDCEIMDEETAMDLDDAVAVVKLADATESLK